MAKCLRAAVLPLLRASVALLLAVMLAAPGAAGAAPPPGAGEHFRRGVQLYTEVDYAGALVEFQRAYDVDPKFQVLYNIAQCHYQLLDYASALQTYQRYLEEGRNNVPAKRRKEVEAEIATLQSRVAIISVVTSEPGASITVDDVGVGTSPLERMTVSAGRRKIVASLPGRAPATTIVQLAGGDDQTIKIEIPPAPTGKGDDIPPPPPPPPPPSIVPPIVLWSVTGALAIGAVITGAVALGASSDAEAELARFPGDAEALDSAAGRAFTFGLVTDILVVTAVAGAAVSTYFTIDFIQASDAAEPPPPEPSARLRVLPAGLAVDGSF